MILNFNNLRDNLSLLERKELKTCLNWPALESLTFCLSKINNILNYICVYRSLFYNRGQKT